MTVAIGVMTCAARWGQAEALAKRIGGPVTVVYDNGGGVWATARRTWQALLAEDATHALVLQEDVAVCRDFRESVEAACQARPEAELSFYANRKAITEARERGESWCAPGGDATWGQAICLPMAWVSEMLAWLDAPGAYSHRWNRPISGFPDDWDDRRVGAFLQEHKRPVLCSVPSLVEHTAPSASLLGHNNGNRVARWFIGETVSGLSVDWAA